MIRFVEQLLIRYFWFKNLNYPINSLKIIALHLFMAHLHVTDNKNERLGSLRNYFASDRKIYEDKNIDFENRKSQPYYIFLLIKLVLKLWLNFSY